MNKLINKIRNWLSKKIEPPTFLWSKNTHTAYPEITINGNSAVVKFYSYSEAKVLDEVIVEASTIQKAHKKAVEIMKNKLNEYVR